MPEKQDVDFGKTAADYAKHRAGFPESFFQRLQTDGWLDGATRVLDLGTGTGTIARGLAKRGFSVTGVDPSQALLDEALKLSRDQGLSQISFQLGTAEATQLPDQSFDYVFAGQCWHWFDSMRALGEIRRLLRPKGRLIVAYFDWLCVEGGPVDAMYDLRKKYNPKWERENPFRSYPQNPNDLKMEGYRSAQTFSYQESIPYTHLAWRGRMRAYAGIGGTLPESAVDAFDREFAAVLSKKFPVEPMQIPHHIWAESWEALP